MQLTDKEKISLIYESLDSQEEIIFDTRGEQIMFNRYMEYLNFLETIGKISIRIFQDVQKRKTRLLIKKR
ncbi:MAG: hypothetical protein ACLSVP_00710 [Fusobacterium sp.]|uniref:hypothetical protein n=1 Tax=Fusobacterium sp. TaxID=68766 RepID=UPI00399301A5